MNLKEKLNNRGITLIALVITIIVLLILAGVSIAMLTGENGILTQAQNAKNDTEEAQDKEKINLAVSEAQIGDNEYQKLDTNNLQEAIDNQFEGRNVIVSGNGDGTFTVSVLDRLKDYIISGNTVQEERDWNEIMKNAVAPESQNEERNEGIIGIGSDGNPVDMDLWQYTLSEDSTFALNNEGSGPGYLGEITSEGEIQGNIPQYISIDNGKNYYKVTDLTRTFSKIEELKKVPAIPATVTTLRDTFYQCTGLVEVSNLPNGITEMWGTFNGCTNLVTIPNLPNNLENMAFTFEGCSNLKNIPDIPEKVTNMNGTFSQCTSLVEILNIPEGVQNMQMTFFQCTNLETIKNIPSSVTNLIQTFQECTKLNGEIELNANITEISNCHLTFWGANKEEEAKLKLKGSCPILNEIVEDTNNPNITL